MKRKENNQKYPQLCTKTKNKNEKEKRGGWNDQTKLDTDGTQMKSLTHMMLKTSMEH